jgi:uncharacterized protein (TIGR02246 family)
MGHLNDNDAIRELLDQYALGWRHADPAILQGTWDKGATSLYIASEKPAPIRGYAEISKYYEDATALYPITKMEISNIEIAVFDEVASAFCDIEIGFKVGSTEHVVFPRATFLLSRSNGAWLCVQYHESIKYEVPQG